MNTAAAITRKPFLDITLDDWDGVHRVDLRAYFVTGQWVAREMVRRGHGGNIINVASVGSLVATREQVHYCAAKGGVLMLTRGMAVELAPHGIRVNAISPGTIETDFNRHLLADVWLVRGGGHTIVVETGFLDLARMNAHRPRDKMPLQETGESLPDQLAARGVRPDDVDSVILTHLHLDHCSGLPLFSKARIVMQQPTFTAALR